MDKQLAEKIAAELLEPFRAMGMVTDDALASAASLVQRIVSLDIAERELAAMSNQPAMVQ